MKIKTHNHLTDVTHTVTLRKTNCSHKRKYFYKLILILLHLQDNKKWNHITQYCTFIPFYYLIDYKVAYTVHILFSATPEFLVYTATFWNILHNDKNHVILINYMYTNGIHMDLDTVPLHIEAITIPIFSRKFKLQLMLHSIHQAISIDARKGVWVSAIFSFKP